MSHFEPSNGAHSIMECVVFFEFAPGLQAAMPSLKELKSDLADLMPKADTTNNINIVFSHNNDSIQPNSSIIGGIQLSRIAPDGSMEWWLVVDLNSIHVHSLKYSRWSEIAPVFMRVIESISKRMSRVPTPMVAVGMKWVDQFIFRGPAVEYDARNLLRGDSKHLNTGSFEAGPRWHCHTGWFDDSAVSGFGALNQLNIDSGFFPIDGSQQLTVTVDHTLQLRAEHPTHLVAFAPSTHDSLAALSGLMENLHRANKQTLAALLNDAILERIDLQPEREA